MMNRFLDENPRQSSDSSPKRNPNRAEQASFLSRVFMLWFEPYVWKSYRKPVNDYLWNLNDEDSATDILLRRKTISSKNESLPISIIKELLKEYGSTFWYCAFLKIIYEVVGVAMYIIFDQILLTLQTGQRVWKEYLYGGSFCVVILLQIVLLSMYKEVCTRLNIKVKGAVLSTLYSKAAYLIQVKFVIYVQTFRISSGVRQNYTTSDVVNLLSVDASRVQEIIEQLHSLFSLSVQIVLSYVFLWFILGLSMIADVIVLFIIMLMMYNVSARMKKLQHQEMKHKDIRGKFMQEIFAGIKVLKMYAWEACFKEVAFNLRREENKILRRISNSNTAFQAIASTSPYLLCLFGYAAYIFFNDNMLDVRTAFVSMALLNSFRVPFQVMPVVFLTLQQFLISVNRINDFLNSEEYDENSVTHESRAEPLVMKNATFSWNSPEGPSVLDNLTLKINAGSLVAVVGPVGSGKSSFISAFLGDMYKISGYINTTGSIAYVPQQAWILNTSIEQNIIFGEKVNDDFYAKAIRACALEMDFETLPAGDQTEIGEKGVNLSGGQKQRISLARAIYHNADIYLLDDPLSAVDSQVADHIFTNVLGPNGVLNKKTRIFVTHCIKFLSFVDQIIIMKNGRISDIGSYNELFDRNEDFCELLRLYSKQPNDNNGIEKFQIKVEDVKEEKKTFVVSENQNEKSNLKNPTSSKLIKDELIGTKKVSRKMYGKYISAVGITLTILAMVLHLLFQTIVVISNVWLSDQITSTNGTNNSNDRYHFLWIYSIFGVVQILVTITGSVILFQGVLKASTYLYDKLLDNVLRWPMSSFDSTPIGRIIGRFSDDVYVLDNVIGSKISVCFILIASYLSVFALVAYVIPLSLFVIFPILASFYIVKVLYVSLSHQLKRIESVYKSPLYSHVVESISGIQSIRAYGFQKKFMTRFTEKSDYCSAAYYSSSVCARWLSSRCEILGGVFVGSITILSLIEKDSIGIGYLALLLTISFKLARGHSYTVINISETEDCIICVERINDYIKYPKEPSWEKSAPDVPGNWPENGDIIFRNYHLRYRAGLDFILKGITFKINDGEKIGIIGRTGTGKSSLILGLFRIIEPSDGTILIDNVDITTIGLHNLRSKLTVIPQDPVLFSGTLRFNLDPFACHTDEQLWNAVKKSYLKNFVESLPGGLSYNVEEGGRNLSFGQRQLICLARALLRKSKILVLDEATASVDVKTDDLIQKTIREEFPESTVVTIAHRLNTLQDYDKILILDDGRVVDFDTKDNLLNCDDLRLRNMLSELKMNQTN